MLNNSVTDIIKTINRMSAFCNLEHTVWFCPELWTDWAVTAAKVHSMKWWHLRCKVQVFWVSGIIMDLPQSWSSQSQDSPIQAEWSDRACDVTVYCAIFSCESQWENPVFLEFFPTVYGTSLKTASWQWRLIQAGSNYRIKVCFCAFLRLWFQRNLWHKFFCVCPSVWPHIMQYSVSLSCSVCHKKCLTCIFSLRKSAQHLSANRDHLFWVAIVTTEA
jgi:hypothetical protein